MEEGNSKEASSKQMHFSVYKLDQARSKLQSVYKARQNLHTSWSKYLDASIKRWKPFVEDFGKKDHDLETKVDQAKERLQEARQKLDETKERLARRDAEYLQGEVLISDMEESPK